MELVAVGRPMGTMTAPSTESAASRRVTEPAARFGAVAAAAEGCDVLLATGLAHFSSRPAAEKLGIPYVYATFCPFLLRSPHQAPSVLLDTVSRERTSERA